MRTSPVAGAGQCRVFGDQLIGIAVALHDDATRGYRQRRGHGRAAGRTQVAALRQMHGAGSRSRLRRRHARPSRAARALGPVASRSSIPNARRCGCRRSRASASRWRRSVAAVRWRRRCSRCFCTACRRESSNCSRMRLPSFRLKLRTQPTWSLRSPASMRLASTTSCHWSWLLKSRMTAHTRSIGASMMVERMTFCSTASCPLSAARSGASARRSHR